MEMSVSYFVGAFIKARFHWIDSKREMFGCSKCINVVWDRKERYCKTCGTKLDNFFMNEKIKSFDIRDNEDLSNKFNGIGEYQYDLDEEGIQILYSNVYNLGLDIDSYGMEEPFRSITQKEIKNEIITFKEKHKEEIEELKKLYDSLEIHWGILGCWK